MTPRCTFCGGHALHRHHPTGRPAPCLPYLDPELTMGLCRRCHLLLHHGQRAAGLERPGPSGILRLRRMAFVLDLLGDREQPLPACCCGPLGACLRSVADEWEPAR